MIISTLRPTTVLFLTKCPGENSQRYIGIMECGSFGIEGRELLRRIANPESVNPTGCYETGIVLA